MDKKIINFKISKQNEVFAFFELANQSGDYKKKLFSFIDLRDERLTKDIVSAIIDDFYKREERLIEDELVKIKKSWYDKQNFFINESEKIFKDILIFQDGVIASPSIWPFFGRFFDKQLITFPYNKGSDEAVFVIAHEYLHFLFYKYIYEKFKLSPEEMSSQRMWDFSEVINVVIQNKKSWIEIFKVKARPYTQHIDLYKNISKDWERGGSMDDLIEKYIID